VGRDVTAREQEEEERVLRAAEADARGAEGDARWQMSEILDSITDAFVSLDDGWRFAFLNRAAERLLRTTREDLVGKRIWEEYPELVGSAFERECRRAVAERTDVALEEYYAPLDLWIGVRAYPSSEGLSVHFRNITARKQAERALRESEERYRALVETTSDWIWEVDENAVYTYVSPKVRDLLGYEPRELLGRTPFDLMSPDEARRVAAAVAGREPFFSLENANVHRDGRLVVLETSGTPIIGSDGKFRGYRGVDRDVTKRKEAEKARTRLTAILEATSDFVGIADISGRMFYCNGAGRRMLGIGEDEDVSSLHIEDAHPEWAIAVVTGEGIPTAIREGLWSGETALLARDGRQIPISQVILSHKAANGTVEYLSTIARDISERRRADRFREEYLQAVSHDLRGPLSVIGLQSQRLATVLEEAGVAGARPRIDAIRRSFERMSAMIAELVDSARIEGGQLRLERRALELRSFIADLLERGGALTHPERIRAEIPPDLPPLDADPDRLGRVLVNLLGNALKYSPPETPVVVQARTMDRFVRVSVADRGPGIAAEDLPHVFDRFYRARRTGGTDGLGLGLYIAKMIVEAHGGRVWAETEAGNGTTFHFTLPASP
jgi:PAS domain S-box-containing protein